MGGGKSGSSSSKDYYGHVAGIVCCGQLDSIYGVMINNDVVWPKAKLWDSQIYQAGQVYIVSGNVYRAAAKTEVDPPSSPWALIATAWSAGTYVAGDQALYLGNLWQARVTTTATPPAAAPLNDNGSGDWIFKGTPATFGGGIHHWPANAIVSWLGRLYTTPSQTNARPPASPWVKWKVDRATSANPLKFTVETYGDAYLYWGTSTQTLDTTNEKILNALGHPPYRNRAILMLKNFKFGTSTVTPPDVTVLATRVPVQSIITGAACDPDADWQVNPWCVLAELLTHPVIGLGLPSSFFDATSWQAEADRCYANPQLHYISPIYTDMKRVRELVADLLSYPDSFVFWSVTAALIAGHWPHAEAAPAFDGTNTISRNQLVEEIQSDSDGWGATANSVEVSFNDIEAAFRARPLLAANLFNRTILKRLQTQKVDRPHIVRASQAAAWASEFAKLAGDQVEQGTLSIRAETATGIKPGSLFLLTDDVLGTSEVQRCTSRTIAAAPAGMVRIKRQTERGVSPQPYSPTPVNPSAPQGPSPSPLTYVQFIQLPRAIAGVPNAVGCLAGRTNDITSGFEVWFQQSDAVACQQIATQTGFAVPGFLEIAMDGSEENTVGGFDNMTVQNLGAVTAGNVYQLTSNDAWYWQVFYSSFVGGFPFSVGIEGTDYTIEPATGKLTIIAGGGITTGKYVNVKYMDALILNNVAGVPASDIEAISVVPTLDEINDGHILIIVFQAANPALFEIMSVKSVTAAGPNQLGLHIRRQQFGTLLGGDGSYVFQQYDPAFIVRKSDLLALTHNSFASLAASAAAAKFIVAPQSAWVQADITDLYDPASHPAGLSTLFNFSFANIFAPTSSLVSLLQNGTVVTNFTTTNFVAADIITANVLLKDLNADMNKVTLTGYLGATQTTLLSQTLVQNGSQVFTARFQLPADGAWDIVCTVGDASGNVTETTLCTLHVKTVAAPLPPPSILGKTYKGNFVTGLTLKTPNTFGGVATTGLTVKYQLVARGAAFTGSWTTVTGTPGGVPSGYTGYGPIPNFQRETYTLWVKSTKAASNDSVVVGFNL